MKVDQIPCFDEAKTLYRSYLESFGFAPRGRRHRNNRHRPRPRGLRWSLALLLSMSPAVALFVLG